MSSTDSMTKNFDEYEDWTDDEEFDCGMMFDGQGRPTGCTLAGSEDCDWECPYRTEFEREAELEKESEEEAPEAT